MKKNQYLENLKKFRMVHYKLQIKPKNLYLKNMKLHIIYVKM